MAKDEDRKKGGGAGMGAVLLILCLMLVVSFMGDGHPMDRMTDFIMMMTWIMAIGTLVLIIFFVLAYAMQTAISDLYESILEDMEHSQFKDKLEEFKAFLDKHVFRRPVAEQKDDENTEPDEDHEEIEDEAPRNL